MSGNSMKGFVALARDEALKNFALFDKDTVPLNLSEPITLAELKPGAAIIITGYIPFNATRFSVNLTCRTPGNFALHFNPRLDRGYVVRNTKVRGHWENEETYSPPGPDGYIFCRNVYFHIMIFCTPNEFQIAINGEHFCAFSYRIPLEEITGLEVNGDIEEVRTRQTYFYVYPDPKICRPYRNLELSDQHSLQDNLEVPVTVNITSGFRHGARIFINGRLKLLPHSFYVNLQKGRTIYPHPEIALHINPRFLFGTAPPCVAMNCWVNGNWSQEERHEGHLSWGPGRDFLLMICCENEAYTIWLGNKMIGEFMHRLEPSIVDTLRITGDVVLYQLSISYA